MIVVVGIGADGMAGLAPASRAELRQGHRHLRVRRQLDLLDDSVTRGDAARGRRRCCPRCARCSTAPTATCTWWPAATRCCTASAATLIRLYGADRVAVLPHVSSVTLACARVGLGGAGHRDHQPGHRASRTPRCAAAARRWCCPATAHSPATLARLLTDTGRGDSRDHGARTTRRPRRTAPVGHRARVGGATAGRRRRPQRDRGALPARRAAVRGAARRRVRPRRADHQAADARGHAGGAGAAARASCCGTSAPARAASRSSGAAADRLPRQWPSNATSSAASGSPRNAVAFGADGRGARRRARGVRRRAASPRRSSSAAALTQPGLLDACWERLPAGRPAGRQRRHRGVRSRSRAVVFAARRRAAALPALPRRAARRVHRLAARDARHPVVGDQAMTVYFIGAGPGAADLITVRGQRLLSRCPVCLYAGSIMPDDLLALCPPDARVVDTGPLTSTRSSPSWPTRTRRASTWRGCTPATRRSTARWPSSAAASTRSASTTRSCPACRLSPPPRPRWAGS